APVVPLGRFPDTAVQALVKIGPGTVPTLDEALRDGSPAAREVAATALGRMGGAARPALPTLIALFRDRDPGVRMRAAEAAARARRSPGRGGPCSTPCPTGTRSSAGRRSPPWPGPSRRGRRWPRP